MFECVRDLIDDRKIFMLPERLSGCTRFPGIGQIVDRMKGHHAREKSVAQLCEVVS